MSYIEISALRYLCLMGLLFSFMIGTQIPSLIGCIAAIIVGGIFLQLYDRTVILRDKKENNRG